MISKTHDFKIILCALAILASSCSISLDKYTYKLQKSAAEGIMYGHHDDALYGVGNGLQSSDTYLVCGEYPAVLSLELFGIETEGALYWGTIPFDSLRSAIINQHEQGGYITLSWHARNPSTGKDYEDLSVPDVVSRILDAGSKERKTFAGYINRLGDFFTSLRDKRGRLIPVIFRPWHENHGNWFWWGRPYCSAEEYKALYQLSVELLKQRGASNLIYAYSPGSLFVDAEDYLERYPGDDIISILGFEAYMSENASKMTVEQTRQEYISRCQHNLAIVDSLAKERGKLIAITESGFRPNYDSEWWTKGLLPAIEGYNPCYINFWSNHWTGSIPAWSTYPGEQSEEDFNDFSRSPKVKMRGGKR